MAISFEHSEQALKIASMTTTLINDVVIPIEASTAGRLHDGSAELRRELQDAARTAGVFAPHVAEQWGGLGLDRRSQVPVFEAAGRSLLGPLALNIAAPDEGNMHLLDEIATDAQKERYLRPLAGGAARSCFAMTEPPPGAGADPRRLSTTATAVPGGWEINGRKWFITGAPGASFTICMARTSGAPGDPGGATMFLIDEDNPGMQVTAVLDTLDESMFAGHGEVSFDHCFVPDEAVLGAVDAGFDGAQVRLAPARLTHCMRWLGLATRAQEISIGYVADRPAFGGLLSDMGMVQQQIADSEIDIAASRALILAAAAELDSGGRAAQSTSIAKTFVAEAVNRVVDRSVQICGATGILQPTMLARFLSEVRPFRIYDGPSETHRWAIARRVVSAHRRALQVSA